MKNLFRILAVILLILAIFLIHSCMKDKPTPPVVTTTAVTEISYTTATSGGDITNDGGAPVSSKGVCWNTSDNPTTENNKTTESGGSGSFTSNITQLTSNTMYYVRAYATNSAGTGYGNQVSFTTSQIAVPVLTTTAITIITQTSAVSGGNITADNGGSVTERGVCWSTSANPTIANSKTIDDAGTGTFTSSITGLTANTTYYVRAYATNSVGTAYGNEISFTTLETVTDIDGNVYNTVIIGNQKWMKENLKVTKYRNGDVIGTTTPANLDIDSESTSKYQWAFDGDENNVAVYGRLYTWYAATDSRGLCPAGWHLPSDAEWTTLTTYLGGENIAGGKLKEVGTTHWHSPNTGATNETGFTGLPGSYRGSNGSFGNIGSFGTIGDGGTWWSSSVSQYGWFRYLFYDVSSIGRLDGDLRSGYSVRCLKD